MKAKMACGMVGGFSVGYALGRLGNWMIETYVAALISGV